MTRTRLDEQTTATGDRHVALLAVSEAIVSHRDLAALFHELAGRLHPVVCFDYLALLLREAASNTLRLHVVEPPGPGPLTLPVEEVPAGMVLVRCMPHERAVSARELPTRPLEESGVTTMSVDQ